jgi:hypothetical protein
MVQILDVGCESDVPFAVIEYLTGGSLGDSASAAEPLARSSSMLKWFLQNTPNALRGRGRDGTVLVGGSGISV